MGFGQELIGSQVCLSILDRDQRVGLAVSVSHVRGGESLLTSLHQFIALASLLSFLAVITFFSLYLVSNASILVYA